MMPTFFRHDSGSLSCKARMATCEPRRLNESELVGYLRGYFNRDQSRIDAALQRLRAVGLYHDDMLTIEAHVVEGRKANNPLGVGTDAGRRSRS